MFARAAARAARRGWSAASVPGAPSRVEAPSASDATFSGVRAARWTFAATMATVPLAVEAGSHAASYGSAMLSPDDLRRIAQRRGGEFPTAEIARKIDGRFEISAHGSREMPVWGRVFGSDVPDAGSGESIARGNIAVLVEYLNTRTAFGRKIGSYQGLKHPTVDILVGLERSRSHVYHAASLLDAGEDPEVAIRMAKAEASDSFAFAGDRAIQFHGGFGFTWECDAQLFLRRALWCQYAYGDALHHRKHLARLLL